jgi:hypothetical protein
MSNEKICFPAQSDCGERITVTTSHRWDQHVSGVLFQREYVYALLNTIAALNMKLTPADTVKTSLLNDDSNWGAATSENPLKPSPIYLEDKIADVVSMCNSLKIFKRYLSIKVVAPAIACS